MTPEQFAEEHGIELDEAVLILQRRENTKAVAFLAEQGAPGFAEEKQRLVRAREALLLSQKKVGVHPVVVEGGWIEKEHDPEAEEGFLSFYAAKGGSESTRPKRKLNVRPVAAEDESQDPEDYG